MLTKVFGRVMNLGVFTMLVVLLLTACCSSKKTGNTSEIIINKDLKYTVLNNEGYLGLVDPNAKACKFSIADADSCYALLEKEVTNHNNHEMVKAVAAEMLTILKLEDYYKQMIPGEVKGEKWVFVNCLCNPMGSDWEKQLIVAKDGGSCYFQVLINLTKKEILGFTINGMG